MFVCRQHPGVDIVRDVGSMDTRRTIRALRNHAEIRYVSRYRRELIGPEARASARAGAPRPGRSITACVGSAVPARLRHMCERAVSRFTHGSLLSEKQPCRTGSPTHAPRCNRRADDAQPAGRWIRSARRWRRDRMINDYGATVCTTSSTVIRARGSAIPPPALEAMYAGAAGGFDGPTNSPPDRGSHALKNYTPSESTEFIPAHAAARENSGMLVPRSRKV